MEASRAHGEQLRVWSDLPCATETEVPSLNAVAEAVWDCGARGLKEEIGADCRRAGAKDGQEGKEKGGSWRLWVEAEAPDSSSRG